MSETAVATPRPSGNSLSNLIDSRRGKMFGIGEIIALALSCFVLFLVLLSYYISWCPLADEERQSKETRHGSNQTSRNSGALFTKNKARSSALMRFRRALIDSKR